MYLEVIRLAINKENKERISISLKHETLKTLREIAEKNNRTVSGQIEQFVQMYVDENKDA